jgi:hypothetical protein
MAITKTIRAVKTSDSNERVKILIVCPACNSRKELEFPKSAINQAKPLTTMSISSGLICEHQFQAFIDKDFKVRGYQKVDFEFENKNLEDQRLNSNSFKKEDEDLFKNLILKGNYLEYRSKESSLHENNNAEKKEVKSEHKTRKMTLGEIYEEFWEFIDDDNQEFREFIEKDKRRKK